MKKKIIAAGIQVFCDRSKSGMLEKADNVIDELFDNYENIDLLVLPEQFYQMDCNDFGEDYGEKAGGEFEKWIRKCAGKYNVNIVGGTYAVFDEKACDGERKKIYNRCIVCDRNGDIAGFYDKIHLFDAFGIKESDVFSPGNELGIFNLDIGKIGVWICYDSRFPEISRKLRDMGADLFCVPAAFYSPNMDHWDIILKSAAVCNVTPVIAVNQYGVLPTGRSLFGRSRIMDAKGNILAGMSDKEGYFVGEIDCEYTGSCRKANPEFENRRPDLYKKWYK